MTARKTAARKKGPRRLSRQLLQAATAGKKRVARQQRNGKNVCALAAFKEHVGINFFASPSVLADPGKKLEGGGKSMRMLKVRRPEDIDSASILRWLKATVAASRT